MCNLRCLAFVAALIFASLTPAADKKAQAREALWATVRNSDIPAAKALLEKGAEVNAASEIGITALWIACSKGNKEMIELLIKHGADVNCRDGIWYQTPLSQAVNEPKAEFVAVLLKAGAKDYDAALMSAAARGRTAAVKVILAETKVAQDALNAALFTAPIINLDMKDMLKKAGAVELPTIDAKERTAWTPYVGSYESDNGGKLAIEMGDVGLLIKRGGSGQVLKPAGPDAFTYLGNDAATVSFVRMGEHASRATIKMFTAETNYYRLETKPIAKPTGAAQDTDTAAVSAAANWPAFRGFDASGVADGQHPPITWNVKENVNVRWKTPIAGLGHSCPIVWGNRVFVTTAVSSEPDQKVRIGNYGDVASVDDTSKHTWMVFCLNRDTGAVVWTKTAFEGVPKIKRHLKGSQANCTPVTDGQRVVACFGSEGMYCYDFNGKLLWQRDLGSIDSSFRIDTEYEWGFGSSPVLHDGLVILQCDLSKDSFIAAYRIEDGSRVWSTPRDEIPSWSSPMVWRNAKRAEIVTNAAQYARGYDPATGTELWRLAKKSEVTVPTPVATRDLVFITSGNRPIQPIFGIRPGATGDISLKDKEEKNESIAWSKMRGGPYMPSPIVYDGYYYTIGNAGMVTCYEAATGKEVYRERLGGTSYTASPVAADGRIYFTAEEGQVRVVKAGPKFELLAVNDIGEYCLATPAISSGALFVRSQHHLWALGKKAK